MCGFSFLYSFSDPLLLSSLKKMTDVIQHRGPDGEGFYIINDQDISETDSFHVGFGHRRLKIIDLSEKAHQPMHSDCGRYVIVFNGEIYNFKELRQELEHKGYTFRSYSDTEVLLKSFEAYKIDCLEKLKGMFSFVIYDIEKKECFFARDRFGIKPFYYWFSPLGFFAVASEIKQLIHLPGWKAKANHDRINDFLVKGLQDHTHETLFEGVYQIPPGHFFEGKLFPHTHLFTKRYYEPLAKIPQDYPERSFFSLFRQSIKEHMESDVPLGAGVSGGLDSSSIVYMIRHLSPHHSLSTFSTVSSEKEYDESIYIKKVQRDVATYAYNVDPSLVESKELLEKIVWFHDEPLGTPSILSEWFVYETVQKTNVKVTLEGHGADEILGGYLDFIPFYLRYLLKQKHFCVFLKECFFIAYRYRWLYKRLLRKMLTRLSLIFGSASAPSWPQEFFLKNACAMSQAPAKGSSPLSWQMYNLFFLSLPKQLHWADRDAMAHSIEARVPFLDHALVDCVLSQNPFDVFKNGKSKALLREHMKDILPEMIVNRSSKIGFPSLSSFQVFHSEQLKTFCEAHMPSLYFSASVIEAIRNCKQYSSSDQTFFRLLTLLIWKDIFKVDFS